jgi:hypothetical protein
MKTMKLDQAGYVAYQHMARLTAKAHAAMDKGDLVAAQALLDRAKEAEAIALKTATVIAPAPGWLQ